jgi:MFS family permease
MTTANSTVQLSTAPEMRGRVMALYMAIFTGGTPLGAPVVGWVADTAGPRWAIGVAAAAGFVATGIAVAWLVRRQHLRVRRVAPVVADGAGVVRRLAPRLVPHFTVEHDGDGRRPARDRRDEAAAVLAADEAASRTP